MEKRNTHIFKLIVLMISMFCLNACSVFNRIPLEEQQRINIRQSQVRLSASNNFLLYPLVVTPYSTDGVISNSVAAVLKDVANIREFVPKQALLITLQTDFTNGHYNNFMNQNLSLELSSIKWLHLDNSAISKPLNEAEKSAQAKQLPEVGDAIIYVDMAYQLTGVFLNTLNVTADVSIYKKDNANTRLIYQNIFNYYDVLDSNNKNGIPIERWTKHNGSKLKKSMHNAIKMLSYVIATDIQSPQIKPDSNSPTNVRYDLTPPPEGGSGYLEKRIKNASIIRNSYGELVIINSSQVSVKDNRRK